MLLAWLSLVLLAASSEAVPLLMSWSLSIRLLDEHNTTDIRPILPSAHLAVALDYHFKRNEIYFSDGTGRIKRARLHPDGTPQESITIVEIKLSDGLAVDWINDFLYWTDVTTQTVEMATLDGLYRRVLFNSTHGVDKPRGIALDPFEGVMFWTDWGSSERVESAGLDGKAQRTLMSTDMFWPNAVTLDLNNKVVYILEAKFAKIFSCNYDGSNKNTVLSSQDYLQQTFGMTFFNNKLYWDSWRERGVFSMDLNSKGVVTSVYRRAGILGIIERMMGIKAVDPSVQRGLAVANPCKSAGCSHKCVNGRGLTPSCICPYGFTLQADGKTCTEEGYLLVSWRRTIRRYTLRGKQEEPMFDFSKAAISLGYHYKKGLVFWSDIEEHRIYRAPLEQLNNKSVVASVETCDGLAVDWVHDVLYWTDADQNTLEAAQLDGTKRQVLFSDNLDQPRSIAVEPQSGYLFWTDWGASPKIERAVLDGSERKTIVDQQLSWPNGITIDFEAQRIYWVDGKLSTISSALYDGSDRRLILEHPINTPLPFSIAQFKDKLYWTDWNTQAILMGNKSENIDSYMLLANSSIILLRPNGLVVVHSSLQKDQDNPCAAKICSDLCLGTKDPQRVNCKGQETMELIKTVKNDSIELSVSGSKPIPVVIIKVKCVGRNGCSNDSRCSRNTTEEILAFMNQTIFNIQDLLPASHYDISFMSPALTERFQLITAETDPPELPIITSVKTEKRSATIQWEPVDTCVPGFDSYTYQLFRTLADPGSGVREATTTDTRLVLNNLQEGVNYTLRLFTSDPTHYAQVTFTLESEEVPICRTGEFLCNGKTDCEDGSDESLETCTAIDSVDVYSKNSSSVSIRVQVPEGTKRNLLKFMVSMGHLGDPTEVREFAAEPCVIWPESYCFTVPYLQRNLLYDFQIRAKLQDGGTGKPYEANAMTAEKESSPPEDLAVIGYTPTSLELQWHHPNQSNGNIRGFIVAITETESFDPAKCCQQFPILESPVTQEEPTYRIEAGSLSPASSYSIIVSVKNLYIGGSAQIQVHTPPPPMSIMKQPPKLQPLPYGAHSTRITWQSQTDLEADNVQYHSLIKNYLLLIMWEGEVKPEVFDESTESTPHPLQSLLESKIGSKFQLFRSFNKNNIPRGPVFVGRFQFPRGNTYRLAWVQVSEYKGVSSLDHIVSDIVDPETIFIH